MPLSFRFLSILDQIFTFHWILACAKIFSTVSSMTYLATVSLMINRPISTYGVLLWRTVARFAIGTLMLGDGISLTGEAWGRSRICMFSMQQALLLCCMIWSVLPLDGMGVEIKFWTYRCLLTGQGRCGHFDDYLGSWITCLIFKA